MKIPCFRCGKKIKEANASNADYVIASDTIVREPREVFVALKQNQTTLAKRAKIIEEHTVTLDTEERIPPTEDYVRSKFADSEFDAVEVKGVKEAAAQLGEGLIKVVVEVREKDIQKTGIVCPDCTQPSDTIIWGVHKL